MRSNFQPKNVWLKVRPKGAQPRICVRSFSQSTTNAYQGATNERSGRALSDAGIEGTYHATTTHLSFTHPPPPHLDPHPHAHAHHRLHHCLHLPLTASSYPGTQLPSHRRLPTLPLQHHLEHRHLSTACSLQLGQLHQEHRPQ